MFDCEVVLGWAAGGPGFEGFLEKLLLVGRLLRPFLRRAGRCLGKAPGGAGCLETAAQATWRFHPRQGNRRFEVA